VGLELHFEVLALRKGKLQTKGEARLRRDEMTVACAKH
jgi:hypothetical protein